MALGALIALGAMIRAHALSIGPSAFLQQLLNPIQRLASQIDAQIARQRRALRRLSRRIPTTLADHAQHHRLGQSAIAGIILLIIVIETTATRPPSPMPAIVPAVTNDPQHATQPGAGPAMPAP